MKKKLKNLIRNTDKLKFGSYILFQEYTPNDDHTYYKISKPKLAIFLHTTACDQTIGFNYLPWINENRYMINYRTPKIKEHIEWHDYVDILSIWDHKPNFKEILSAFRSQELKQTILSNQIDWSYD